MKKAFGQTVRDLKRGVNKRVLKVPGIEQKVLDATSNESWGPHGSLLADIALATRNFPEYQIIMAVLWKRMNDTGKNWRHVYKALTVLDYLVAHGSERVVDDIRGHTYLITTLSDFLYIDSSGRDQGSNVRKRSQSLLVLVNDNERVIEVRQKAVSNRDRFQNTSAGGMYRQGSEGYGDRYNNDHHGSREENQNAYGRDREYGYRDHDRYSRYGDSNGHDGDRYGRDYEDRYSRDGYKDNDYRGRSVEGDQYGARSRGSDRDRSSDDDGSSSRQLEQKFPEKNIGAPPSFEETVSESRSPVRRERDRGRDGETSAAASPMASSDSNNPNQVAFDFGHSASPPGQTVEAFDEFDPRGSVSAGPAPTAAPSATPTIAAALPTASSYAEIDLLGDLSGSLAIVPTTPTIPSSEADASSTSDAIPTFAANQFTSNFGNQGFDDPFGDGPFKAFPSTNEGQFQQKLSTYMTTFPRTTNQNPEVPQLPSAKSTTIAYFNFGDSFSADAYSESSVSAFEPPLANFKFFPQELSTPNQQSDLLADILPPSGPAYDVASQVAFSAPANQSSQPVPTYSQSARQDIYGQETQSGANMYGQPGQPSPNAYGQSALSSVNPYSQPTQPNADPYGQPTLPNENPYGQPAQANANPNGQPIQQNANPYGQPAQSNANPNGQPVQSNASPYVQPAQPNTNLNGHPTQPNANPYGQPAQSTANPNGQPAQPNANPNGRPTQLNANPNGQPAQQNANPYVQPAQPSANPYGQPAQPNANPYDLPAQPNTNLNGQLTHPNANQYGEPALPNANPNGQPAQPNTNPNGQLTQPNANPHCQPVQASSNAYAQPMESSLNNTSMSPQISVSAGQSSNGSSQVASNTPVSSLVAAQPQNPVGPAAQVNTGSFIPQHGSGVSVASQSANQTTNAPSAHDNNKVLGGLFLQPGSITSILPQTSLPTGELDIVPQSSNKKFEPKSAVWADTLSRGLVNLNISGPKANPLADIGIDFDDINRKEKRMEKPAPSTVTSTVTMGKAMGSGIGHAGASILRPPATPMVGSGMMGMVNGPVGSMGLGGYGGMNQQPMGMGMNHMSMNPGMEMGMNMGMNPGMGVEMNMGMNPGMLMNMGMLQGAHVQPRTGMPGSYNPMMGSNGYSQQPYGGSFQ
ncbi:Clathrin interactor EPSIN 2 [Hibiscus syriacus]|uniref:Clathrin interactor EPSIN 2 n=1 Tax=Hibiscus syriacus TaxID=106335 RepID=A0A6A3BCU9_HIBSY|nr:Clathrin interactor EPSIN 2 [Hibiscus syriacus]